ncbi:hypothetical protein BT69DRAFT_1334202 [Atractiella rhizophila]|nr:hypothetical protein BT69DRAFT_1334202 [Atractiella rhizophila]
MDSDAEETKPIIDRLRFSPESTTSWQDRLENTLSTFQKDFLERQRRLREAKAQDATDDETSGSGPEAEPAHLVERKKRRDAQFQEQDAERPSKRHRRELKSPRTTSLGQGEEPGPVEAGKMKINTKPAPQTKREQSVIQNKERANHSVPKEGIPSITITGRISQRNANKELISRLSVNITSGPNLPSSSYWSWEGLETMMDQVRKFIVGPEYCTLDESETKDFDLLRVPSDLSGFFSKPELTRRRFGGILRYIPNANQGLEKSITFFHGKSQDELPRINDLKKEKRGFAVWSHQHGAKLVEQWWKLEPLPSLEMLRNTLM